ncbi:MAG TPA: hypothetical protein VFG36_05795, partial [Methanoregula sp.]|nr:hypothetical protein [Methanoregula sp.]
DNLSPLHLQDLRRGTDIPRVYGSGRTGSISRSTGRCMIWMGRLVYPRAPGIHTVQVRTGRRKFAQRGRVRDFSPENGGYTSPLYEILIAGDTDV